LRRGGKTVLALKKGYYNCGVIGYRLGERLQGNGRRTPIVTGAIQSHLKRFSPRLLFEMLSGERGRKGGIGNPTVRPLQGKTGDEIRVFQTTKNDTRGREVGAVTVP